MAMSMRIGGALSDLIISQMMRQQQLDENDDDESDSRTKNVKQKILDNTKFRSISSNTRNGGDITAVLFGILMVAGLATFASYNAFHGKDDYKGVLSKTRFESADTMNDDSTTSSYFDDVYLPRVVVPTSYIILMIPDLVKMEYKGLVKISVDCVKNTTVIVLHSEYNTIGKVEVRSWDKKLNISGIKQYKGKDRIELVMVDKLVEGNSYSILIGFLGKFGDNQTPTGFYTSKYTLKSGETRIMASTMFEPNHARKGFPCFDEPQYKATFKIIMMHNASYMANSNMLPYKEFLLSNKMHETHFKETPLMSTYLVAFMVSEYKFVSVHSNHGFLIRVFAPEDRLEEARVALRYAPLFTDYYSHKFRYQYMMDKLDIVPVTNLPAAGEETWGMIYFAESYVLQDPETSTASSLAEVLNTIAHEIVHQWFGDLVTMEWWNDLWLKESFATFLAEFSVQYYMENWDVGSVSFAKYTTRALIMDSYRHDHPITSKELDIEKLTASYDDITYLKGACIIKMLHSYLGDDDFFAGITVYLKKYEYQNAKAKDFFDTMKLRRYDYRRNSDDPSDFIDSWINKPGYPLVTVTVGKNKDLVLTQERFKYVTAASQVKTEVNETIWRVPIKVFYNYGWTDFSVELKNKTSSFRFNQFAGSSDWYKLNWGAAGFYRVNYPAENWLLLIKQLNDRHTVLPVIDRANLINDAMHLARANYNDMDMALDMTKYLASETQYAPWYVALGHLGYMLDQFYTKPLRRCFEVYLERIVDPAIKSVEQGWSYHLHNKDLLLPALYRASAISAKSENTVLDLRNKFLKWMFSDAEHSLSANMRSTILQTGVRFGGSDEYNYVWGQYLKAYTMSDKHTFLGAAASTTSEILLKKLMRDAHNTTLVSKKLRVAIYTYVCSSHEGNEMAWETVKKEWKELLDMTIDSSTDMKFLLEACLNNQNTQAKLTEVKSILANNTQSGLTRSVFQTILENIDRNNDFVTRHDVAITKWFQTVAPNCIAVGDNKAKKK